jgi:tRNA dimethylallyltransferase
MDRQSVVIVGGTGLYIRSLFEEYKDLSPPPNPELRVHLKARLAEEGLPSLVAELEEKSSKLAESIDLRNPQRVIRALERSESSGSSVSFTLPAFQKTKLALCPTQEFLDRSIARRIHAMMHSGFVAEVEGLLARGVQLESPAMRAIGYQTIAKVLRNELSGDEACERIEIETRQYAKRQRTWLRSEPQLNIVQAREASENLELALQVLNS